MELKYKDYYRMVGLNIAYYRRLANFTQDMLAAKLGMEQSNLSRIENGGVGLSLDMLFRIAEALEVEPKKLLDFRD